MAGKNIIDTFTGFIGKYGNEALGVARALDAILGGLALVPNERAKVKEVIKQLETAATSIAGAPKPVKITINKKDIEAAVAAVLPKLLDDLVTEAVMKALADKEALDFDNVSHGESEESVTDEEH